MSQQLLAITLRTSDLFCVLHVATNNKFCILHTEFRIPHEGREIIQNESMYLATLPVANIAWDPKLKLCLAGLISRSHITDKVLDFEMIATLASRVGKPTGELSVYILVCYNQNVDGI